MKHLYVIGNGFDIACGLSTKYIDYFNFLRSQNNKFNNFCLHLKTFRYNESNQQEALEALTNEMSDIEDINIWEFAFTIYDYFDKTLLTDKSWNQIEEEIKLFCSYNEVFSGNNPFSWEEVHRLKIHEIAFKTQSNQISFANIIKNYLEIKNAMLRNFEDFDKYVVKELREFEKRFANYINYCVKNSKTYINNAHDLLLNITNDENTDICSFNFTNPFNGKNVINCHGLAADKNVIFGIENLQLQNEKFFTSKVYKYTKVAQKTYILSKGTKLNKRIKDTYKEIYFFGLSFSDQDFDYFKYILDLYRDKPTKLIFCLSVYDKSKENTIRETLIDSVNNLINRYSQTFGDSDYLNSLIISGRFDIKLL